MIGDSCRGFLAIDKDTALRTKVSWARVLVKPEGKTRPSVVKILEGARRLEIQIWWELLPWSIGVYPAKKRKERLREEREEEDWATTCQQMCMVPPEGK